jgi:hypothetical protein
MKTLAAIALLLTALVLGRNGASPDDTLPGDVVHSENNQLRRADWFIESEILTETEYRERYGYSLSPPKTAAERADARLIRIEAKLDQLTSAVAELRALVGPQPIVEVQPPE